MKSPRTPDNEEPAAERACDFRPVDKGFTEEMALAEAERCLNCKKPFCVEGCPVNINIPRFIEQIREKDFGGALDTIREDSMLPAICGRVCPQENQCEGKCIRGKKSEPVAIGQLERFLGDRPELASTPKMAPKNGKKVAVVGSGPSGITCAGELARNGFDVTVFEAFFTGGGVLVYGIPEFRLPRSLVQKYRHVMCSLGVRVRPSTTIGGALHIDDLLRDGYDAVFVGTGTWRARKLGIPGESRGNVLFGIDYLVDPTSVAIGQNVAVIGAGNVAMDVARTALRSGARKVTVYARSRHISAIDDEVELTELDGAEIVCGKAICAIDDNGPVFETAIFDEDNNVVGYEEELDHASADTVVIAASQVPKDKLVLTTGGLETDHRGLLSVDENGMTTVPGVFAAGDVVNGPLTVVHAVAGAKIAVEGMTSYLGL